MAKRIIRSAYGEKIKVALETSGQSRTQQHFKDQCDINKIVARARITNTINHTAKTVAKYGDFTQYVDAPEAYDRIAKAEQAFESLPSQIRHEFHNNPKELLEFVYASQGDSEDAQANFKKGVKMGIFNPPKAPEPEKIQKVEITNPPTK